MFFHYGNERAEEAHKLTTLVPTYFLYNITGHQVRHFQSCLDLIGAITIMKVTQLMQARVIRPLNSAAHTTWSI